MNFLAPLIANLTAPLNQAVRRAVIAGMPAAELASVRCPDCGRVIAVYAALTRCLYQPARDGGLGPPLSTDSRERVLVACDRCRVPRYTSGRAVARNRHNARSLLA